MCQTPITPEGIPKNRRDDGQCSISMLPPPVTAADRDRYELSAIIQGYRICATAEGKSHKHREMVASITLRFYRFLEEARRPTDVRKIGAEDVRAFIVYLGEVKRYEGHNMACTQENGLSKTAINTYVRALSAMFTWLTREEIIQVNPFKKVTIPKPDSKVIVTFSEEQISQLLNAIPTDTNIGYRDWCIVCLLLDSGIRLNELCILKIEGTDLDNRLIRVFGKGSKERQVPIGARVQRALWKYIQFHRPKPANPRITNLFLNRYGEPLKNNRVYHQIRLHARQAGILGVRASPHTLRHTFATEYLKNGGDVFSLQRILGHSNLDMVRRYVHFTMESVQKAHALSSPMDNLEINRKGGGK